MNLFDRPDLLNLIQEDLDLINEKLVVINNDKKYGQVIFMAAGAGCYPAGTEFFTGTGWKSIEDYVPGDSILVYDKDTGQATLTKEVDHIDLPVDQFYTIRNNRMSFTTSKTHKHLIVNENTGQFEDKTTTALLHQHETTVRGNRARLVNSFSYSGNGLDLSDDEIRLKIAVFADGHFVTRRTGNVCRMSLKKSRKIIRLRELLDRTGTTYREYETKDGFLRFEFQMDTTDKEFPISWYETSGHQLSVICDEVPLWDGSISKWVESKRRQSTAHFFSTSKQSMDFVQFAYAARGYDTSVYIDERDGRPPHYALRVNLSSGVGLSKNTRAQSTTEIIPEDHGNRMYCFTTPTGYFVIRQNGKIFVSGNSGKGFAIKNFMSTSSYKIRDVDEFKVMYLKLNALTRKYPELDNLDLRNPADVGKLHAFVKKKGIKNKTLDLLLSGKSKETLPNIIFDVTAKDPSDILKVVPKLVQTGYEPQNIHIVWVLADYGEAVKSNRERARVVPDDTLLMTHEGAARTMMKFVRHGLPKDINGEFVVINGKRNANSFIPGSKVLTKLDYVRLKKAGKPYQPDKDSLERVVSLARENVPLTIKAHKDINPDSYDRRRMRRKHNH